MLPDRSDCLSLITEAKATERKMEKIKDFPRSHMIPSYLTEKKHTEIYVSI